MAVMNECKMEQNKIWIVVQNRIKTVFVKATKNCVCKGK